MDVHCATCGEPWDIEHLRQDLIYDVGASDDEAERWLSLIGKARLSPFYRDMFQSAGWEFGECLLDVRRCLTCPPGAELSPESEVYRDLVVELLGEDEDLIAFRFRDFQL